MTERLLYSPAETAEMLGIDIKLLRQLCQQGEIAFILVGRRRKFAMQDIERFIENNRRQMPSPATTRVGRSTRSTKSEQPVYDFTTERAKRLAARRAKSKSDR